jgi:CheY-like chemotaxis protein
MSAIEVLVVEDDDDIREMLSLVLEMGGCQVMRAADGREALRQLLDNGGHLPSLVLLDLMMPHVSGADVLSFIRRDPRLRHLPVLVISGDGNARRLAMQSGADGCLLKPVEATVLLALTKELAAKNLASGA